VEYIQYPRGEMHADEFREYILGFILYKYLSEKTHLYANKILAEERILHQTLSEENQEHAAYITAIREEALVKLE
tara:strand:- start:179 stop:403 length:225 start_codon:yes stop_codon:yes gene_type:complete